MCVLLYAYIYIYMKLNRSARSLAGSGTPPFRSYMRAARSGPSALELNSDSSSDDEAPNNTLSQPRPIPRSFAVSLPSSVFTIRLMLHLTITSYLTNLYILFSHSVYSHSFPPLFILMRGSLSSLL